MSQVDLRFASVFIASHLAGTLVFGNEDDEDPANDRKDSDKTGQDVDQPPVLCDQEAGREQVAVAAPFARRHLHGENDQHQEQAIDEQRQRQPESIEGGLREGGLQARADRRRAQRFLDPCDEAAAEDPGGRDDGRGGSRQHLDPGGAGGDAAVLGVGGEADQGRDDARLHLDQEGEQQADEQIVPTAPTGSHARAWRRRRRRRSFRRRNAKAPSR